MSTFLELVAAATEGLWKSDGSYITEANGNYLASIVIRGVGDPIAKANAQLIARCSPDTMKRVYEALAQISNMPWEHSESPYATVAREALKLLDTP